MQYRFMRLPSGAGLWNEGDLAEFDDATAAWLLRDVPGCIVRSPRPTPKRRAIAGEGRSKAARVGDGDYQRVRNARELKSRLDIHAG